MFEFKLPDLGEGVHEGELLKWYVKEGDVINEDDPLLDVETDKAAVTIPSPRGGTVAKANGKVGDTLQVGNVIVVIDDGSGSGTAAEAASDQKADQKAPAEAPAPAAAVSAPASTGAGANGAGMKSLEAAPVRTGEGPVPAAPATRRLARELGIELARVRPSGPGGRVTIDDVKAFADGGAGFGSQVFDDGPAEPFEMPSGGSGVPLLELEPMPDFAEFGPVDVEPLRSIRRKIAKKMVTSMVVVPHVCHMDEADVTDLEVARKRQKAKLGDDARLTMLGYIFKAVSACLKNYPSFNASLDPFKGQLIYKKYYNIGFAADTPKGLMVPVVHGVDGMSMLDISQSIYDLATQARDGTIAADAFKGGTFTVTNIGSIGGTGLIPTINYPEVAILGMGKLQEKPVVRDGEIVVRKMLPLTLAFDHRIADGADAARFMNDLVDMLADPMAFVMRL